MAIQIFGSSKSFDTKKAQRRGAGERHLLPGQDLRLTPPDGDELGFKPCL